MANTVVNKLVVKFDDVKVLKEFLEVIKGSDSSRDEVIDFNVIKPMPKELEDTVSGSKQWKSLYYYAFKTNQQEKISELEELFSAHSVECFEEKYHDRLEEFMEEGESLFNNYMKYGATDWYMWRNKYWGTKQNAYDSYIVKESDNSVAIYFTTVWNGVPYLMEILIGWFPELEFTYKFADEDVAYNCGKGYSNENGEFFFDMVEDCSDEAIKIYCECWDEDEEDYVKVDGVWIPADYLDDLEDEEDEE